MRLSEKEVRLKLEPSIGLEYVRDSPLFRQQLSVFDDSFTGIDLFAGNVQTALGGVQEALGVFATAQRTLAFALQGKDADGYSIEGLSGRCLFTNALPDLQDLSDTMHAVASSLKESAKSQKTLKEKVETGISAKLAEIQKLQVGGSANGDDGGNGGGGGGGGGGSTPGEGGLSELSPTSESAFRSFKWGSGGRDSPRPNDVARMEALYTAYEKQLGQALLTREELTADKERALMETRKEYEMARFDMVANLNMLDSRKKLLLSDVAVDLYRAVLEVHRSNTTAFLGNNEHLTKVEGALEGARRHVEQQDDLWDTIRVRVQGELSGHAPPPRAPPGALSPLQPR